MFLSPRYSANVMMLIVVTVVTVALNGLAAAWQLGLIAHLPMSPCQRTAVCESEWKRARGGRHRATPTSCHLTCAASPCFVLWSVYVGSVTHGVCLCSSAVCASSACRCDVAASNEKKAFCRLLGNEGVAREKTGRLISDENITAVTIAVRCLQLVAAL